MAKQSIGIGTSANDGTGDALRVAFDKTNDNFDEIYADDFVTSARIADEAITEAHLDATNTPTDNYILSYDSASSGFTWVQQFDGDITSVVAGNGLTGGATDGDATLNVNVDDSTIEIDTDTVRVKALGIDTAQLAADAVTGAKIADDAIDSEHYAAGSIDNEHLAANSVDSDNYVDGSIDTAHIANDQITHDKLEARYTAKGSITTYAGAVSVDWSAATNFVMGSSLTGAIEFDFTNFKTGQVLTIHNLTGSQTITLDSDAATSETFNKVGGNDYDGASTNVLIVECIDDDATAVFNYSILTYTSDTTP